MGHPRQRQQALNSKRAVLPGLLRPFGWAPDWRRLVVGRARRTAGPTSTPHTAACRCQMMSPSPPPAGGRFAAGPKSVARRKHAKGWPVPDRHRPTAACDSEEGVLDLLISRPGGQLRRDGGGCLRLVDDDRWSGSELESLACRMQFSHDDERSCRHHELYNRVTGSPSTFYS